MFSEIESILKKAAKEPGPLDESKDIVVPKVERFTWLFRKNKMELLISSLESLKATMSLELNVLLYAEKHPLAG